MTLAKIRSFNRNLANVRILEEKLNKNGEKSEKINKAGKNSENLNKNGKIGQDGENTEKVAHINRKSFEDIEEAKSLERERLMFARNRRRELAFQFMNEGKHYSEAFRRDEHGDYVYS